MASATFSGNGAYRLDLSTWITSGNYFNASISVTKTSGSGYWTSSGQPWSMNIAGNGFSGSWTYDFRSSTPQTIGITTQGAWVGWGYNTASATVNMASGIGSASTSEGQTASTVPNATINGTLSEQAPTSIKYQFSGNGDNGSAILEWQAQVATDSGFTQNVQTVSSSGTTTFNSLSPGTTHYFRSRGRNANGWGAYGANVSGDTLPSTPPGMTVTPAASGQSATIALTPPSGASGVTKYTIEYRPLPAATPTTSLDSPTNSATVTGLVPGVQYEWRASAWFNTYQSPWSSWTTVQQPNPNTSPGDFFDGNKAASADVTYAWTGTANNSTSRANGRGVDGWEASLAASGGTAVVQQVTGGFSGTFAARLVMKTDATAAGATLGMANATGKRAEVQAGAAYVGSIYVNPSRAQRLAARITFLSAAGAVVGSATTGAASVAAAGSWKRLTASATAPATAAFAIVTAVDVTGTSWSAWLSGEFLDADAAMVTLQTLVPYFDGSTPDSGQFVYEWLGATNASASRRLTLEGGGLDPLQDPDCPTPPSPPVPPTVLDECIEEVGVWRRYWLVIPSDQVNVWIAKLPTITLQTGAQPERQVRIRYFANPLGLTPSQVAPDAEWDSEMIVSYMPANTSLRLDGVEELAWASVAGGDPVLANRLLYGTGGSPATWPVLSCGSGYLVALDVPLDSGSGNLSFQIELTGRML